MRIEQKIAVAYLLIKRMRKRREKRKPQKELIMRILQKREKKGAFIPFHYYFFLLGYYICWFYLGLFNKFFPV